MKLNKGTNKASKTVADILLDKADTLTRADHQVAALIMKNYPVSGLGSITVLAKDAKVSVPTVARFAQKLGFIGFSEFQASLRLELNEQVSGPIAKRQHWVNDAPKDHIINRFTESVVDNISQSLNAINLNDFDEVCQWLSDNKRKIFIVGGRVTRTLADYFFLHMQIIRANVIHINSNSNSWAHYCIDIQAGDVVVVFDIRRYENSTLKLVKNAKQEGAHILLFTDQWKSPIRQYADHTLSGHITVPSAWDSNITCMLFTEIILAEIQNRCWNEIEPRVEKLENLFDKTKLFRKFY